jgi:hypothetical protein
MRASADDAVNHPLVKTMRTVAALPSDSRSWRSEDRVGREGYDWRIILKDGG